jgi:hypothetical protein
MHYDELQLEKHLCEDDHRFLSRLACVRPDRNLKVRPARQRLFDALKARVGGFEWMWAHSFLDINEMQLYNLAFQTGRVLSLRQGMEHSKRAFRIPRQYRDNEVLHELAVQGQPFACSMRELVSTEYWDTTPEVRAFVARSGLDDVIYSIFPYSQEHHFLFFVGFGVGRAPGQPPFSPRDIAVVHHAVCRADWTRTQGINRSHFRTLLGLSGPLALHLAVMASVERRAELAECSPATTLGRTWRSIRCALRKGWPDTGNPPQTPQAAQRYFDPSA